MEHLTPVPLALAVLVLASREVPAQCTEWRTLVAVGAEQATTSLAPGVGPSVVHFGGWCVCSPHTSAFTPTLYTLDGGTWSGGYEWDAWPFGVVGGVAVLDVGAGPTLHAWGSMGSTFDGPVRLWKMQAGGPTLVTPGLPEAPLAVAAFDSGAGPAYHVATASAIWRWEAGAWIDLGATVGTATQLVVHDDGSGPALYAGGSFLSVAGVAALGVARWNGVSWSAVPGLSADLPATVDVTALASLADAGGRALYAGGRIAAAGGSPANGVARWDGASWSGLGVGLPFEVAHVAGIVRLDRGTGEGAQLVVSATGVSAGQRVIAIQSGGTWSSLSTLPGVAVAGGLPILAVDAVDAPTDDLVALRTIAWPSGWSSSEPAVLPACAWTGELACFGDGTLSACPCGNDGASAERAGCLNSLGSGGALRAHGVPELTRDSLVLDGTGMTDSAVLYFQGATFHAPTVFGDGLKCVGGPFVRLGTKWNVAGASAYPALGDASVSARGFVTAPGTRHYQARYRNSAPFCTADTFNYTNSVTIVWEA